MLVLGVGQGGNQGTNVPKGVTYCARLSRRLGWRVTASNATISHMPWERKRITRPVDRFEPKEDCYDDTDGSDDDKDATIFVFDSTRCLISRGELQGPSRAFAEHLKGDNDEDERSSDSSSIGSLASFIVDDGTVQFSSGTESDTSEASARSSSPLQVLVMREAFDKLPKEIKARLLGNRDTTGSSSRAIKRCKPKSRDTAARKSLKRARARPQADGTEGDMSPDPDVVAMKRTKTSASKLMRVDSEDSE